MADSQQNIDWTAVRQAALKCLDATWDMVWWAERSQEDDYDVDGAALHLAAIDTAGDALTRAISMFEPGLFDSLVMASVGEGPRRISRLGTFASPPRTKWRLYCSDMPSSGWKTVWPLKASTLLSNYTSFLLRRCMRSCET